METNDDDLTVFQLWNIFFNIEYIFNVSDQIHWTLLLIFDIEFNNSVTSVDNNLVYKPPTTQIELGIKTYV